MPLRRLIMPAALRGFMYFILPFDLLFDDIVGRKTPPREAIGSDD
jgi:hypothetical protein